MSAAFFSCFLIVVLLSDFLFVPSLNVSLSGNPFGLSFVSDFPLSILEIFLFNLALSAFVVVTLSGFTFFPLSIGFLFFRATVWGLLVHGLTTAMFLVSIPTLILEGEAYALAAVAGTIVGASWLMPKRLYRQEDITRTQAFREALKESLRLYVLVIVLLLVAATAEAVTLLIIR